MKYEIKNIVFDGNNKYNPKLYWDLYRIYMAYNDVFNNNSLTSLVAAAHLASSTGVLCFNQIIKDELEIVKEVEELLNYKANLIYFISMTGLGYDFYKDFLNVDSIKKLNELYEEKDLKEYCEVEPNDSFKELSNYVKEDIELYFNKIINFIPKHIYEQIDNKEMFSLGFVRENIYNQLKEFYNKLENWLIDANDCNNQYELELLRLYPLSKINNDILKSKLENNNYVLTAFEYKVIFKNAKILYNDIKKYNNLDNININYVYQIKRKNDNKTEICIELIDGTIILECDSIKEEPNFDNMCFKNFKGTKYTIIEETDKLTLESDVQIIEFSNYVIIDWDIESFKQGKELKGYFCYRTDKNEKNKIVKIINDKLFKTTNIKRFCLIFDEGSFCVECDSIKVIDK